MGLLHFCFRCFSSCCFSLGLGVSESAPESFKSRFPILYSSMALLKAIPLVFKARYLGVGACLNGDLTKGKECLIWSTEPSPLKEKLHIFEIPFNCGSPCLGKVFGVYLLLSYHFCCGPLILYCGADVHLVSRSFAAEITPYVAVVLLCPWEKVSSGPSPAAILNCLLETLGGYSTNGTYSFSRNQLTNSLTETCAYGNMKLGGYVI